MTDCTIIRGSATTAYAGKQGSTTSPGSRHEGHESANYVLEGSASMRSGPDLERVDTVEAGDFVYIPAGAPHRPLHPTDRPVRALIARTDPNEQESVRVL